MAVYETMALGGGCRLGTWGLRQGKDIIEDVVFIPYILNNLQVFFYSPYGEQIANLNAGIGDGEKLTASLEFEKLGGLKEFNIKIKRNNKLPLFSGCNVRLYYKNNPFALGYVKEYPETYQDDYIVSITGFGYSQRLREKNITVSYTSQTVNYILNDLAGTYFSNLGINYNPSKIVNNTLELSSVSWDDKSIYQIITDLITASNYEYETQEWVWGIDEQGDFYFKAISAADFIDNFFEGYEFHAPVSNTNYKDIVNNVLIYRTKSAANQEAEYVTSYSDSDSIADYGQFDRKVTVPDYIDNTTALNIGKGIVNDLKDPKVEIEVNNLIKNDIIDFGYYKVTTKPQDQKNIVSDFSKLSEWDTSLTNSSVSVTTENVLTKKQCYSWESVSDSTGEYIEKDLTNRIYAPQTVRFYVRADALGDLLKLTLTGEAGYELYDMYYNSDDAVTGQGDDLVLYGANEFTFSRVIDVGVTNEWVKIDWNISDYGLYYIDGFKIEINKDDDFTVLIDRLEVYNRSFFTNNLSLEKITYNFSDLSLSANAAFGSRPVTLTDELKKVTEKNSIPFDIFAKQ